MNNSELQEYLCKMRKSYDEKEINHQDWTWCVLQILEKDIETILNENTDESNVHLYEDTIQEMRMTIIKNADDFQPATNDIHEWCRSLLAR